MIDVKTADVEKFLSGVSYPASRSEIVQCAVERGATDAIVHSLRQLPDQTYESTLDVEDELGRK